VILGVDKMLSLLGVISVSLALLFVLYALVYLSKQRDYQDRLIMILTIVAMTLGDVVAGLYAMSGMLQAHVSSWITEISVLMALKAFQVLFNVMGLMLLYIKDIRGA
jgi:hypothetical protein